MSAPFGGAYAGRRVLVTGDTGFKGAWLCAWLAGLGARAQGLALPPPTRPSLHAAGAIGGLVPHEDGDLREPAVAEAAVARARPEIVFHLAAQSLVRASYDDPVGTFATNVMGTVHVLEALRRAGQPCAVVVVSSDKCYENREQPQGYREGDALGGHDPYSASKGAAEIVAASYRRAFFDGRGVALATARAGNVIGPGDRAADRIVPDAVAALAAGRAVLVRNPGAVRPWQHVLEPLSGYLALGAALLSADPAPWCEAWNFGPRDEDACPVRDVVERFVAAWGGGGWEAAGGKAAGGQAAAPHEAGLLRLSIEKARERLGWRPAWTLDEAVERTARGERLLVALLSGALAGATAGEGVVGGGAAGAGATGGGAEAERVDAVRALLRDEIAGYTEAARREGAAWARG